jgi:hypothetical protein
MITLDQKLASEIMKSITDEDLKTARDLFNNEFERRKTQTSNNDESNKKIKELEEKIELYKSDKIMIDKIFITIGNLRIYYSHHDSDTRPGFRCDCSFCKHIRAEYDL